MLGVNSYPQGALTKCRFDSVRHFLVVPGNLCEFLSSLFSPNNSSGPLDQNNSICQAFPKAPELPDNTKKEHLER